jgi:hypothetical protein
MRSHRGPSCHTSAPFLAELLERHPEIVAEGTRVGSPCNVLGLACEQNDNGARVTAIAQALRPE